MNSIVEYYSGHERYKCGYCKSPNTNYSHGMWAHALTVSDYQDLIDRGWRRSGKYCYKPTMEVICCPMYTIRCRAMEFKISKSQKKVIKRFNKILVDLPELSKFEECPPRKMSTCSSCDSEEDERDQYVEPTQLPQDLDLDNIGNACSEDVAVEEQAEVKKEVQPEVKADPQAAGDPTPPFFTQKAPKPVVKPTKSSEVKKGAGADPNKAPCKKAKQLRWERKVEKLKQKGVDEMPKKKKNVEKTLEQFLNELPEETIERLDIRVVRTNPPSLAFVESAKETHSLYVKYQMGIHNSPFGKCGVNSYNDFLVSSPLIAVQPEDGPPTGYGSFHQQYWIDEKLIAVGVIDILPKCVSSVYFFYDPAFANLTLGTFGALREISLVRYLNTFCPEIQHYYMGYYIHSCPKMRYKGNYHPSDLLCPETFNWFPIKECLPKLEESRYCRLDPDIDNIDTNAPEERHINKIPILFKNATMPFSVFKQKSIPIEDIMFEYASLVGKKTAEKIIIAQ